MNTITVTLGELVDHTLQEVQNAQEVGLTVVRNDALDATQTTFTLTGHERVNISDVLEFGTELMLVRDKSADANPVFTVTRGHYQTTAVAHGTNETGTVNPQFNRRRVAEALDRSLPSMEANGLVLVLNTVLPVIEDTDLDVTHKRLMLQLPPETREVVSVSRGLVEARNWEFIDNLPLSNYPNGRVVRMSRWSKLGDEYNVTYKVPFRWSNHPTFPVEADTLTLPEGTEYVPCAFAKAWLSSGREFSRQQIDRSQEWNVGEPARGGVSLSTVRALWQEYYRALDEARRLEPQMLRRPFFRRL